MGEQSVCNLIVSKYDKLTKQTKTVADYVLANRKETQYMSITTLAENCDLLVMVANRLTASMAMTMLPPKPRQ